MQLASKKGSENLLRLYDIDGTEALGSCLRIYPCSDSAPELSECTIQWFRTTSEDGKKELISGIYMLIVNDFDSQRHNHTSRIFRGIYKVADCYDLSGYRERMG